jgi:hypothetical protein
VLTLQAWGGIQTTAPPKEKKRKEKPTYNDIE